jgi:hypothetical protein
MGLNIFTAIPGSAIANKAQHYIFAASIIVIAKNLWITSYVVVDCDTGV